MRRFSPSTVFIRASLWQTLSRDARHPVARRLRRQLKQGRRLKVLPVSMAFALLLLFIIAFTFNAIDDVIIWTLPLWLMLFSAFTCSIWITRIVGLMSRQARAGVLDEVSMIPPGRIFIFLSICKVVLNEDDAVIWLSLLRRGLAGILIVSVIMSLCIALTQVGNTSPLEFGLVLFELLLVAIVIPLEHTQSVVVACLLALIFCTRVPSQMDKTSIAVAGFLLLQILTYSLAVAIVVVLEMHSLGIALALFMLIREVLVFALWRFVLRDANEDNLPQLSMQRKDALRRYR